MGNQKKTEVTSSINKASNDKKKEQKSIQDKTLERNMEDTEKAQDKRYGEVKEKHKKEEKKNEDKEKIKVEVQNNQTKPATKYAKDEVDHEKDSKNEVKAKIKKLPVGIEVQENENMSVKMSPNDKDEEKSKSFEKNVEPCKQLSHSISREDEKMQIKQKETKRKTIENSSLIQNQIIQKDIDSPVNYDVRESENKVEVVREKKKSISKIENTEIDQHDDSKGILKQSVSEEKETEQQYTIEEPVSPSESRINLVEEKEHMGEKDIQVVEISSEYMTELPISEAENKEGARKNQVTIEDKNENLDIPEIRLTQDTGKKSSPKLPKKAPKKAAPKESAPQKISKSKDEKVKVVQQMNRLDILSAIEIINNEKKQNKQIESPLIEDLEGQMTLIEIVQNAGHGSIITEIISDDVEKGELAKNVGLKAIERTLRDGTLSIKDVRDALAISSISSEKAQETWDSLENEWKNIKAAKDTKNQTNKTASKVRDRSESPKKHVTFGENTVVE